MAISSGFQEIDVHNMTKVQALAAIDARLRRANASVYRLKVVHGYHGVQCFATQSGHTTGNTRRSSGSRSG